MRISTWDNFFFQFHHSALVAAFGMGTAINNEKRQKNLRGSNTNSILIYLIQFVDQISI